MNLTKHYFPGGNTCKGFVNFFDGIIAPWVDNKRIFVLKGGPGVGKNTFMNLFSKRAREKGYAVEHFHCASDTNSLDAVHIPSIGITMLDGTAPHIIDPVTPGAVDEILNLGIYLDQKGLEKKRGQITRLMQENARGYKRTFAYLGAAGRLRENSNYYNLCAIDMDELREEVQDVFGTHELKKGNLKGAIRHLFADAITPQGYIDYFSSIVGDEKIISLHGPSAVTSEFIKMSLNFAMFMGYGCEVFYSSLLPDQPIHLIIRDLDMCITTNLVFPRQIEKIINLNLLLDQMVLDKYESTFQFNELYEKQLMEVAIESLMTTKDIHDEIEAIYKSYMDFDKVTEYTTQFVNKFFNV